MGCLVGGYCSEDPAGHEDEVGVEHEEGDAPEAVTAVVCLSDWSCNL